jgi:hypothetical protein
MPERGAYVFALRGIAALAVAAIAGAIFGGFVLLIVALLGVTAAVVWTALRWHPSPRIRTAPRHQGPPQELRLLVVANDALDDPRLADVVARRVGGSQARVLLLGPLAIRAFRRLATDTDVAHAALQERLDEAAATFTGLEVETAIADDQPLQAIEDALGRFGADEVIVVTAGRDSELARRAYERFAVPVSHVALGPVGAPPVAQPG